MSNPISAERADTKKRRIALVATLAAALGSGLLVGCCGGFGIGWAVFRSPAVLPDAVKAVANQAEAPKDDMTYQQLEDRLNAGGFAVTRQLSPRRKIMWFGPALEDGKPFSAMNPAFVDAFESPEQLTTAYGCFRVAKHDSVKEATAAAGKIADERQRPVFAWGPFVFQGQQDTLDRVRASLK